MEYTITLKKEDIITGRIGTHTEIRCGQLVINFSPEALQEFLDDVKKLSEIYDSPDDEETLNGGAEILNARRLEMATLRDEFLNTISQTQASLMEELNKEIIARHNQLLLSVMRQVLQREPTTEDGKDFEIVPVASKNFTMFFDHGLKYMNRLVGRFTCEMQSNKWSMTFKPADYKKEFEAYRD